MPDEELEDLIANHLDRKVRISASGRVMNRERLAKQIIRMVRRLAPTPTDGGRKK